MKPVDISIPRLPGQPVVSPDGRRIVVPVTRIDLEADDYTTQLYTVPPDGSASPRELTHGWRDGAPRFSPDGRWLAFVRSVRGEDKKVGKPQVYVLPLDGGEPRRITDHPLGATDPVWNPDSTRIAYTARVPEDGRYGTKDGVGPDAEAPRRITKLFYRVDDLGFMLDRPRHVFVVSALDEGAEPVQVTDGPHDHGDVDWSPAGDLLTFAAARHDTWNDDIVRDVWVCAPDGSGLRALTDGTLAAGQLRFTAAGDAVCFTGSETDGPIIRTDSLWRVPLDGGPATRITDRERHHLAYPGVDIQAVEEGVLFANENRGAVELLLVPYDGGDPTVLVGGDRQVVGADRRGGTLALTIADPTSWGELFVDDRRLSAWNLDFPALPMEEVTASAPDGYPVHGWVVRPPAPPAGSPVTPRPVLLMIHGGPFTQYGWRLFDEAQVYARAGYAVVMGNPRGSSGYGEAHGRAVIGDVGVVSAGDLLALLDRALKADDLDGSRVGVLGGSHGGFMTTWLAAHHGDRFKAAASERAVNAIDSFVGSSDIGWYFTDLLWGTDPAMSPLTHVDRITLPMLIIHSEQDWRCPVEQAQRLYVALKLRGAPVELLLFPGEGHEMSRSGRPSHRISRFDAILDWFDRWL
jgi:dipeptidyl aminopeptidase/acylaminoacyl peptidase